MILRKEKHYECHILPPSWDCALLQLKPQSEVSEFTHKCYFVFKKWILKNRECSSQCEKNPFLFSPDVKYLSIVITQFNAHKITSDQIQHRGAKIYTNCLLWIITLFSLIHIYQTATSKCLCHEAEGSGCIPWALHGNLVWAAGCHNSGGWLASSPWILRKARSRKASHSHTAQQQH